MPRRAIIPVFLACCAVLAHPSGPAGAVVVGRTDTSDFSDPQSTWYGMDWDHVYVAGAGSAVAVGYFYLLTASHAYLPGTLTLNGDTFQVVSTYIPPKDPGQSANPDLRLVRLQNLTNPSRPLPGFYQLYTGSFSIGQNAIVVATGFTGTSYPPDMYSEDPASPRIRRWGTNKIRSSDAGSDWQGQRAVDNEDPDVLPNWSTYCLRMTYNLRTIPNKYPTQYEVGLAEHDSGGGVFVKPAGSETWKLAGINLYKGWGSNAYDITAAQIPHYSDWLLEMLRSDVLPGDANLDGNVDTLDYLILKQRYATLAGAGWADGDFDSDGDVDRNDLLILKTNFGYSSTPHPDMIPPTISQLPPLSGVLVPEPASLLLLAAGGAGLLARRKRNGTRS